MNCILLISINDPTKRETKEMKWSENCEMKSKNYCQFGAASVASREIKIRIPNVRTFTAQFSLVFNGLLLFVKYHQFVLANWAINAGLSALNRFTFQQIMCYLVSVVAVFCCCRRYCYCQSRRLPKKNSPKHTIIEHYVLMVIHVPHTYIHTHIHST